MTNESRTRLNEMFYRPTTGDGVEDDGLAPLHNERLSRPSLSRGDRLMTMTTIVPVDRSISIQKRTRPVSPDITKKPRYHVQQMESVAAAAAAAADDDDDDDNDDGKDLRSKSSASEAHLMSASSRFQEEKTLVHLAHEQISPKSSLTTRRYLVVKELFDTEQKYCSCLQLLQNHFAAKLSLSAGVDQSDIRVIFPPCLRQILAFHGEFVRRLGSRLAKWTESSTVVDLIVLMFQSADCDLLKLYQTYFSLFRDSLNRLRRLRRLNSENENLINELERDECCRGLALGAYLLTPIQRIPRYVLLLEQLAKCTAESHPDYQTTSHCLAMLSEFLCRLNNSIESSALLLGDADDETTLPKRKRRFHFNTISFRQNSSGDVGSEGHTPYVKRQDSNSLKSNRVSLDFSFKKKREPEFNDKKVLSEICLNESGSVEYSTVYQPFHAQERTLQLSNSLNQAKRRIEQSSYVREVYGDSDRKQTKSSDGAKGPYFTHEDVTLSPPPSACESNVHDTFAPEKKSRLGSLSRRLRLTPKKKRNFRSRTSVGDVIRNFFIRKGFSKRTNYSRHRSAFDENKDSCC